MLIKRSKKRDKKDSAKVSVKKLQPDEIQGAKQSIGEMNVTQNMPVQNVKPIYNTDTPLVASYDHDYEQYDTGVPRSERRRGDRRRGYRRIDDRNLISRAQEEYNAIRENAAQEGFEVGLQRAQGEIHNLMDTIHNMLNIQEEVLNNAVPDIAEIAVKIAEKIIKTEVSCDETLVLNIVKDTIKQVEKSPTSITIYVNPVDYENVQNSIPSIYPDSKNVSILVTPHNEIEWGSCIVETNCGIVDANFATQLSIIKKAFDAQI